MIKTPVSRELFDFARNVQNVVLLTQEPIPEEMLWDLVDQVDDMITRSAIRVGRLHKELTGSEY